MLKYLANLLKSAFKREKPAKPAPVVFWSDILKKEELLLPQKRYKTMLLPSRRVLLWKTEEPVKQKKKQPHQGLNFLFQFDYENIPYVVKSQKVFNMELSTALTKISALMKKKVFKDKADTSENGLTLKMTAEYEHLLLENATISKLADDTTITSLLVNDIPYQVVRNGAPIQSVLLALTPIAGQICMPCVTFNEKKTVQSHWFVKNEIQKEQPGKEKAGPSKKEVDSAELSFVNEENREYNVNGYTLKHKGEYFNPDPKDIGRRIAVVVDSGPNYPVYAAVSSRPITEPVDEVITDKQVNWCKENRLNDNEIRVMCYNILADLYLNLNMDQENLFFSYCPKTYQRVLYRTPIFLKQMQDFIDGQVSLVFLQEVDIRRHDTYIEPFLKTVGYSTVISKKGGQSSEGVALAFDEKMYRLLDSKSFSVAELVNTEEINEDIDRVLKTSPDSDTRFKTRPTVVQIVVLEHIESGKVLVCANTHLHHNPLEEHLKVFQSLVCIRKLMEVYNEKKTSEPNRDIRILFGGDFNSTPDGAVFEMISSGFLSKSNNVWKCDEKIVPEDIQIEKSLNCLSGTPEYTNYTSSSVKEGFVGCLDYIWGLDMNCVRNCPMPEHEKVTLHLALPSVISPSDHLPIICDIKL